MCFFVKFLDKYDFFLVIQSKFEITNPHFRFGASLTAVSDPSHPHHPLHDVQLKKGDRRRETTSLLSVTRNWNPDGKRKR